jgi:hypothetical protein
MSRSSNVASVCLGVVRLLAYPLPVCLGLLSTWPSVFKSKGGGSRTCRNLGGFLLPSRYRSYNKRLSLTF